MFSLGTWGPVELIKLIMTVLKCPRLRHQPASLSLDTLSMTSFCLMVLNAIHIDYFHNMSQDLTSKLQSSLPRCLLDISICMPGRRLKHTMSKPESLIALPSQLHTQLCPFQVMMTLSFYLLRPKALMSRLALPFHSYSTSSLS